MFVFCILTNVKFSVFIFSFKTFTLAEEINLVFVIWGMKPNGLAMSSSVLQGAIAYRFCCAFVVCPALL